LVDNSDSVCQPCQPCYNFSENHFDNVRSVQNNVCNTDQDNIHDNNMTSIHDDNAIEHHIRNDNAIIDTYQLQSQMTRNLLCWQCVQKQLKQNALTSSVNLIDAVLTSM